MVEKKLTGSARRKLLKLRNSLYLCLPQSFCERHGLRKGDSVLVVTGENLRVVPMEREEG
jgi:antitoxin component of MazEF toxin-antitoxin module